MSLGPRSIAKAAQTSSRASSRFSSTSSSSSLPPLRASLILSRQPLLTKTPHPLETAYYDHTRDIRHALSNPLAESFYFREGSLPHRRWQQSEWEYLNKTYGSIIAGPAPEVGDIPAERPVEETSRDHWEKRDSKRAEKSLERFPEEEVFCLVEKKEGGWGFPEVVLNEGEGLHEAVEGRITGLEGWFGGKTMDSWLVTKKPVGYVKKGEERTFFLRSHILGGEPKLSKESPWKQHAWLTQAELEERLGGQWDDVKQMFGVRPDGERGIVEDAE